MRRITQESILGALAMSAAFTGIAYAQTAEPSKPLILAQTQTEQEKAKRKEQEHQKGPPPGRTQPPPGQPPGGKNVQTPPDQGAPAVRAQGTDSPADASRSAARGQGRRSDNAQGNRADT